MAGLTGLFSLFGSVVSAAGQMAAAREQAKANEMQAKAEEAEAKEREAVAVMNMEQERRQKELKMSQLQATAAASGFSATDPTALLLAGDLEKYGEFRAQVAHYGGQSERSKLDYSADIRRQHSKAQLAAAKASAMGSILGGFGSFAKGAAGGGSVQPQGIYG